MWLFREPALLLWMFCLCYALLRDLAAPLEHFEALETHRESCCRCFLWMSGVLIDDVKGLILRSAPARPAVLPVPSRCVHTEGRTLFLAAARSPDPLQAYRRQGHRYHRHHHHHHCYIPPLPLTTAAATAAASNRCHRRRHHPLPPPLLHASPRPIPDGKSIGHGAACAQIFTTCTFSLPLQTREAP